MKNVKLSNSAFHPAHTPAYLSFFNTVPDWVESVCVRVWFQHIQQQLLLFIYYKEMYHSCLITAVIVGLTAQSYLSPTPRTRKQMYTSVAVSLKKNNKKLFPLDPAENEAYFTDKRIMPLIFYANKRSRWLRRWNGKQIVANMFKAHVRFHINSIF